MNRFIDLTDFEIMGAKQLIEELKTDEVISTCPPWHHGTIGDGCDECERLFPKVVDDHASCPCYNYSRPYLIKRLRDIIKYNEDKKKEKL